MVYLQLLVWVIMRARTGLGVALCVRRASVKASATAAITARPKVVRMMARVRASQLRSLSTPSDSVDDSSFSRPESSAGSRLVSFGSAAAALRVADGAISGASGRLAGAFGGTNPGVSERS
jgi:hypothetical protein